MRKHTFTNKLVAVHTPLLDIQKVLIEYAMDRDVAVCCVTKENDEEDWETYQWLLWDKDEEQLTGASDEYVEKWCVERITIDQFVKMCDEYKPKVVNTKIGNVAVFIDFATERVRLAGGVWLSFGDVNELYEEVNRDA